MSDVSAERLNEMILEILGKDCIQEAERGMMHDLLLEHCREREASILREVDNFGVRTERGRWVVCGRVNAYVVVDEERFPEAFYLRMHEWSRDCYARLDGQKWEICCGSEVLIDGPNDLQEPYQRFGTLFLAFNLERFSLSFAIEQQPCLEQTTPAIPCWHDAAQRRWGEVNSYEPGRGPYRGGPIAALQRRQERGRA